MIILLTVAVTVYTVGCWRLANLYLSPIRSAAELPPGLYEVAIPSGSHSVPAWTTDGLAQGKGEVVFVLAHGYGGNRASWDTLMLDLHARYGGEAVAPAMPGQDAHPDDTVGFGPKEAQVIADTVRWVRSRYREKQPRIVLVGLSMGGAAAWLATEQGIDVDGVVTEGAYADLDTVMRSWFDARAPGSSYYLRPVMWMASWKSGIAPSSVVPERAAAAWRGKPCLVIQGEDDFVVPRVHAERLARASGAEIWIVPGATHAQCQGVAPSEYTDRLWAFAERL